MFQPTQSWTPDSLRSMAKDLILPHDMPFKAYYEALRRGLDTAIEPYWPKETIPQVRVVQAMIYSLKGGKRFRPILTVLGSLQGPLPAEEAIATALPLAAAIECVHVYSLVHDDLPCMDDDDLRRGRPTNHKVFGESLALLAGDALLTYAFELIATHAPRERVADCVAELAYSSGCRGMVAGQDLDMLAEGHPERGVPMELIHSLKTGALISGALRLGALAVGASRATLATLTAYGDKLGLAFQIADDLLDVTASTQVLGKPAGSDLAREKQTYPALYGIEKSQQLAQQAADEAKAAASSLAHGALRPNSVRRLLELADFVVSRSS